MSVVLDWADAWNRWTLRLALYAVVHPEADKILYLGKADGSTVRSRWNANDKHERVWQRIQSDLGVFEHRFLVAEFYMPAGTRLTRELVCDVESLLIYRIKPWANTQNSKTRGGYSRPGLVVRCEGEWPLKRKVFRDEY